MYRNYLFSRLAHKVGKINTTGSMPVVVYSINENGEAVIPRVAIRMESNNIAEVRGIAAGQNMDPYIGDVVKEKMTEFPDGAKYEKKSVDMKLLTEIEEKNNRQEELSKEDLKFLYEVDSKIEGFGLQKDPRIEEIIEKRDFKSDLSLVTGFSKEEIGIKGEDSLGGDIKYFHWNFYLDDLTFEGELNFPQFVRGGVTWSNLKTSQGIKFPQHIGDRLDLSDLKNAKGLVLPKFIGGELLLDSLESAEEITFPDYMGGGLGLGNLKSVEGLNLPQSIGGDLNLGKIKSLDDLKLPQSIGGNLDLWGLESTEGLNLPQTIGGNIYLNSLKSAKGLNFPQTINGGLYLAGLESIEGLNLPQFINGNLSLGGVKSLEGLRLPKTINGEFYPGKIEPAELQELKIKYPQFKFVQ